MHGGKHSNPGHGPIESVRYNVDLPDPVATAFAKRFIGAEATAKRAVLHISGEVHFEIRFMNADGKFGVAEFVKDGKFLGQK